MLSLKLRHALLLMSGGLLLAIDQTHAQTPPAPADVLNGMPRPEVLANADKYRPPMLTGLAAKLARQPDMTGMWAPMAPADTRSSGEVFDPEHAFYPPNPLKRGESGFSPHPGTYDTAIPYTPEYQKLYRQYVEEGVQGHARDTFPTCVPYGVPRIVGNIPTSFDIVQAPEVIIWYADYEMTERRIFLDGREHPSAAKSDDPYYKGPTYSGHSVGHWEGNTLVIDTVDMIVGFLDGTSPPHSDQLRMNERLRLINKDTIENQITLTDPVAFMRPWVLKRYYHRTDYRVPGAPRAVHNYLNLNDRACIPNVKLDENGFEVMMLPQEIETEAAKAQGKPTAQ
jgi:hypothetical protein